MCETVMSICRRNADKILSRCSLNAMASSFTLRAECRCYIPQRTDVMNKVENFRNKTFFIAHGTADGARIFLVIYCIVITSPALAGGEVLQLVCLFVCDTMYIMYWMCTRPITRKYFVQEALLVGNYLTTSCQLVANFREFFHLQPWCQHDCGRSLLSTISLFGDTFSYLFTFLRQVTLLRGKSQCHIEFIGYMSNEITSFPAQT